MKLTKKELEELVEATENSDHGGKIQDFYESLGNSVERKELSTGKKELSAREVREEIARAAWDDERSRLLFNFRWLTLTQPLQFHPRISAYHFVHSTVSRGGYCYFGSRSCPCLDPLRFDCPLLIKRRLLLPAPR